MQRLFGSYYDLEGGNMAAPLLPHQFYPQLNQLVNDYRQAPKEEELEQIYDLIQDRLQKVDFSSEIQELSQLRVKLQDAHVEENHKVVQLLQEALDLPKRKAAIGSQESQAIDWEHMLPKETWKEIFAYLGEDPVKMSFISKSMHELSQDPSIQALIIEKYTNRLSIEQLIERSKECGPFVKKLDLSHRKDLTDHQLASLIQAYPNLQTLNLSGCLQMTTQGLTAVAKLSQLQFLDLSSCRQITDQGLATLTQLQNLRTLDLSRCLQITDQGLTSLIQLQNLRTLSLLRCTQITDQGLTSIAQLQKLRTLSLLGCLEITDQGLASLAQLPHLQTLDLSNCNITDQGLTFLAQLPHLETLYLSESNQLTEEGLRSIQVKNILF